ncbi:putative phosphoribosyltransferase [Herbihabitans rhizosphaerae]|uniref:Putative phosphoribosyltransferase n=1 Tax=Herbihabitans rhizosphaerae TaxID=1872711 RepID=A0A4Q7KF59_9PSEU|nr:phosphoribosyltransferase family protein [Herbihabitans rhizosphaerae]RZS32741.1 putative phosphoribosyltransferase [Herbihabitans rhizosphaerae]
MRHFGSGDGKFDNREHAGRLLGERLAEGDWSSPVVLGLPRGGVPVAGAVARILDAPLDVVVARKIGAPDQPEFGLGAVTADGPPHYDQASLTMLGLTEENLSRTCAGERAEARRREELYHQGRAPIPVDGRDVIVVDDGLATGVTAWAALNRLRGTSARRLVFAAPVCAPDAAESLGHTVDRIECLICPPDFRAVGQFYVDFSQTTDEDVLAVLAAATG